MSYCHTGISAAIDYLWVKSHLTVHAVCVRMEYGDKVTWIFVLQARHACLVQY